MECRRNTIRRVLEVRRNFPYLDRMDSGIFKHVNLGTHDKKNDSFLGFHSKWGKKHGSIFVLSFLSYASVQLVIPVLRIYFSCIQFNFLKKEIKNKVNCIWK